MPNPLRISRFRFHRCGRKYILAFSVALSTGWMNFFFFFYSSALRMPFRFFTLSPSLPPDFFPGEETGAVDSSFSSPALLTIASLPQPPSPSENFFSLFFSRPATHQSIHLTEDMPLPRGLLDGLSIRGRVKEYPLSTLGKAPRTIFLFFCQAAFFFKKFPA